MKYIEQDWLITTCRHHRICRATTHVGFYARFDRGYTGHEGMAGFGLINMNGRLYDPYLQRFLSPDLFIQDATDAQNYNRYTYCLNNPLMYSDPTGWQYLAAIEKYINPFYYSFMSEATMRGGNCSGSSSTSPISDLIDCEYTDWYLVKHNPNGGNKYEFMYTQVEYKLRDPFSQNSNNSDPQNGVKNSKENDPLVQGRGQNASKELDPSKLSFEIKDHIVVVHNTNLYTKNWSINNPYQVAVTIKQQYKLKTGQELLIDTQSLGLEIYVHAILFDYGIQKRHTDNADCGEYNVDGNRFFWDGIIDFGNNYPYTHITH